MLLNQKMKEINDLKIQLQNKEKTIELLNKQISNKIIELNNLKNKISNNNSDDLINIINPGEKILSFQFVSNDQKISYSIKCKNTTTFVRVEEKLYEVYPEYKETENYFILFIMEMQLKDLNQLKKIILKVEYLLFLIQENKMIKIHIELNNKKLNKI